MGKADQQIYVLIYDPKAGSLVLLFESSFKANSCEHVVHWQVM